MGYAKGVKAVEKVRRHLEELTQTEGRVEWRATDASKTAYHIRQGFAVSEKLAPTEPYATFARLKERFVIRVRGDKVIAEPRTSAPSEIKQGMLAMTLPENMDVMEIIGAAVQHKAQKMFFPQDATLEESDLLALFRWSNNNDYYIVVAEVGITLTKEDVGDLAWQPST